MGNYLYSEESLDNKELNNDLDNIMRYHYNNIRNKVTNNSLIFYNKYYNLDTKRFIMEKYINNKAYITNIQLNNIYKICSNNKELILNFINYIKNKNSISLKIIFKSLNMYTCEEDKNDHKIIIYTNDKIINKLKDDLNSGEKKIKNNTVVGKLNSNVNIDKKKINKLKIPNLLRHRVFVTFCGNNIINKCYCCNYNDIYHMVNFHCGHVISEKEGGNATLINLRPVCPSCNLSMGSQNMFEYMYNNYNNIWKKRTQDDTIYNNEFPIYFESFYIFYSITCKKNEYIGIFYNRYLDWCKNNNIKHVLYDNIKNILIKYNLYYKNNIITSYNI